MRQRRFLRRLYARPALFIIAALPRIVIGGDAMEPMHDRYAKSDHERWVDSMKSPSGGGFPTGGTYGHESVVPWLIIAAVLTGLLTRSIIGAVIAAVVVYV